ncbi:MAG: hypothetical protein EZS28_032699 [Streblomastix strix]|uniref:Uncharacterized protein n=1 Tax=Streblomastix strix TaxID=222440 RepID=A0A5J4UNA3_9EUKA|nr:MAG: hypothetical protein EZS28_032699 [Streblomastix strix]
MCVTGIITSNADHFADSVEKYFRPQSTLNSGAIYTTINCAYRMIGLIRLYCPTSNNYITTVEPKNFTGHGLSVRYLFGKQVDINPNGTFTTTDVQPVNLVGGQDLYDGQNENGANQLVNLSSAIKQIDLEYPQMLIICVSNQLQGITLQSTGGNGFPNVCFKQNLVDAPVLWGQNMMSQQCLVGQNKSLVFTLYDNFGRKMPMQYMDMYNNLLLEIQFQ